MHGQPSKSTVPPAGARPGGTLEVLLLAYPLIITMGAEAMMGVVDTIFMGWVERAPAAVEGLSLSGLQALGSYIPASDVVGTAQQGAVGLAAVLAWTVLSIVTGTLTGVNTFVSQNNGAGNHAACARYTWQAVWLSVPGAVYAGICALLAAPIVALVAPVPEVIPFATDYLGVRCAGAIFIFLNWAIIGFYRSIGDTRTPMWVTLGVILLNVPLNYLLVFGTSWGIPALGPMGAALATVLASAAGTAVYFALFCSGRVHAKYDSRRQAKFSGKALRRLVAVGLPIGGTWFMEMASWTLFTVFIARIGQTDLAAHGIVLQLMHFAFLPGVALLITATTLVGQYLGAGKTEIAERAGRTCLAVGMTYMGTMALVFVLLREPVLTFFTRDPAVITVAGELILIMAAAQVFDAVGLISAGAVRGAGDTRYPMLVGVGSAWLIFVPGVFLLGNGLGLGVHGAWFAVTLYLAVQGLLLYRRFQSGAWKRLQSLTEPGPRSGRLEAGAPG